MNHTWELFGIIAALVIWGGLGLVMLYPHLKRQFARVTERARTAPARTILGAIAVGIAIAYGGTKPTKVEPEFAYEEINVFSIRLTSVKNLDQLTTLTIPDVYDGKTVKEIEDGFCEECTSITSVSIPYNVQKIGKGFFERNGQEGGGLRYISVASSNEYYAAKNGFLYSQKDGELIVAAGEITSVEIPTNITKIADCAFFGCTKLASVKFAEPSQLSYIGGEAFVGCAFKDIRIPASVNKIDQQCFAGCSSLTNVVFYQTGDLTIGGNAFGLCDNLESVYYCGNCPSIDATCTDPAPDMNGDIYVTNPNFDQETDNEYKTYLTKAVSYIRKPEYVSGWGSVPGEWQYRPVQYGGATFTVTYKYGSSAVYAEKVYDEALVITNGIFGTKRFGYSQRGWTTASESDEVEFEFGDEYTVNADITLYPVWVKGRKWVINFDPMGGSGVYGPVTNAVSVSVHLPKCTLTKDGYVFAGWSKRPNGKKEWSDEQGLACDWAQEMTVYAIWLRSDSYGIAFDPNQSDSTPWTMDYQSVGIGKVAKLNPCTLTPPEGKCFAGWKRTVNWMQNKYIRYDDGIMVFNLTNETNAIVVLKAIWEEK